MGRVKDLTGEKFGKLTPISYEIREKSGNRRTYWFCKCDCGGTITTRSDALTGGRTVSCGCVNNENRKKIGRNNAIDLIGHKYGKLLVIEKTDKRSSGKSGNIVWKCKCDCGNITYVPGNHLRSGHTSSCGCINYSKGEKKIEDILKENNIKYQKQYTFNDLVSKKNALLRFDFAIFDKENNLKQLVEFDGRQHFKYESNWNQPEEEFKILQENDKRKNDYCKEKNIKLVRISYLDYNNIDLAMLQLEEVKDDSEI